MENNFINNLKENLDIVNIIQQYVSLNKSGNNYKACCPFHKENTPSFVVNEEKQFFKCFGCGKSGDVYTFIQEIENLDFYDAVKFLAGKIGYQIPKDSSWSPSPAIKEMKTVNLEAGRYYYKKLLRENRAIQYLRQRGVKPEIIKVFGLGYADNSKDLLMELKKTHSADIIVQSGLAIADKSETRLVFRDRLIFPIFNIRDEIIGFGGRNLGEYGPKYLNSKETLIYQKKENLYALNIAKKNIKDDTLFLVEGYMDVISMYQNGYPNTVATLGTALTVEQAKLLSKYAGRVYMLYDSDEAGTKATLRALDILLDIGLDSGVILLGDAKDPDDFFKQGTNEDFNDAILNSKNYLNYNILQIKKKYDLKSNIGREGFVKESVNFIKKYLGHKSARQVFVEDCVIYISEITGYSIKSIGVDIFGQYFSPKQFSKQQMSDKPKTIELENQDTDLEKKEQLILLGLNHNRISFKDIGIEDFIINKNKLTYYQIQKNNDISIGDDSNLLSQDEYALLIKNIKNLKLDMRIKFLESVQLKHLNNDSAKDMEIALILADYIIKLKKSKT